MIFDTEASTLLTALTLGYCALCAAVVYVMSLVFRAGRDNRPAAPVKNIDPRPLPVCDHCRLGLGKHEIWKRGVFVIRLCDACRAEELEIEAALKARVR
jgi:hypothetical protein